ncbi:hypothetical protein [Caulobacter sp. 1776]|uniref:hypothetical protein n=1 Tax=Caulobacter sp. 1776 TaxID=3156420 RepID=UPI003399EB8D
MLEAVKHFPVPWTPGDSETRVPVKAANGRTLAYAQLAPGDGDVALLIAASPRMARMLAMAALEVAFRINAPAPRWAMQLAGLPSSAATLLDDCAALMTPLVHDDCHEAAA